jgi:AcrR family transcriptional regulator
MFRPRTRTPEAPQQDRRIQKTRKLLHEALFSLLREQGYESITVKDILDRANVGLSTFYTHFGDEDELLVSGMQDLLRSTHGMDTPASAKPHERILGFSLPLFEHVRQHHSADGARIGKRGWAVVHEHLQKVLAGLVTNEFKRHFRDRRKPAADVPIEVIVQYVASTFILVLNWWVEDRRPLPPKSVNEVFRALVLPTLVVQLEGNPGQAQE